MRERVKNLIVIGFLLCLGIAFLLVFDGHFSNKHTLQTVPTKAKVQVNLRKHNPQKSFKGITLVSSVGTAEVLAIDMQGQIVNIWPVDGERARLLPNGNLLTIAGSKWGHSREPWKSLSNRAREYTWGGELVWEYVAQDVLHHDVTRLANGNTLLLRRAFVPTDYKNQIHDSLRASRNIRGDAVIEVTPQGEVVYDWFAHEHLDLNYCGSRACAEFETDESTEFLDWTHINTAQVLPDNPWYRAGDTRFTPGNLLLLPRNWWMALIIDRQSGKEVWRYRGQYRGGVSGGHEAQMIPPGLPGAGNILLLDNGTRTHRGSSIILEIEPPTKKIVWSFEAGKDFFTKSRGAVQRLPNGNTFISEDRKGRIFEVTPTGTIVWELQLSNESNRAKRYPLAYCPVC